MFSFFFHYFITLINNLIGENARLARENQLLKQRMEASGISVAPDVGDWVMLQKEFDGIKKGFKGYISKSGFDVEGITYVEVVWEGIPENKTNNVSWIPKKDSVTILKKK